MKTPVAPGRRTARNLGPSWGYRFLVWAEHWGPRWIFRPLLMAGAWVGLACLPAQRRHSRAYHAVVLGRPPRLRELWRHFYAVTDVLLLKLRAGRGAPVHCELDPEHAADFWALVRSDQPAFFGTFHFGGSDLLGYLLGRHGRRVSILRLQMGNSDDTRFLGERFGEHVSFLWVNDPRSLLFELKDAIEAGASIALQCDRLGYSARSEPFQFLGATRLFPFTIYHLANLFGRPVIFCVAVPHRDRDELRVFSSPVYTPDPSLPRAANFERARRHFQAVLTQLETLVRRHPSLWFNFTPLNPAPPPAGAGRPDA